MPLIDRLKLLRGGAAGPRKRLRAASLSARWDQWETSRLIAGLIFVATVAAIVLVSSVGVSSNDIFLLPNQRAAVRITASVPFTYESAERTRLQNEQVRDRTPPVYRLDQEALHRFDSAIRDLVDALERFEKDHPPGTLRVAALAPIVNDFNARGPYRAGLEHVALFLDLGDAKLRYQLMESSLVVLREI
ncbi:MAG: phosphohydrolase, partial [Opitutaceae bacterium]